MKQISRFGLVVCLLWALGVLAQAPTPQPFSSDMSITTKNGSKIAGKWFFATPSMRMDMTSMPQGPAGNPMGGNMSIIVDGGKQTTYLLMPALHMYMESHGTAGHQNPAAQTISDLNRWSGDPCANHADATCKKLGAETANGRSCDKWEVTDKNYKSTVWIDQKLHFPVRVKGDDGSDVEFTNIKEGAQDASLFTVPPGYRPFDPRAMGH